MYWIYGEIFDSLEANFLLLSPHEKSIQFSDFIIEILYICYSHSEVFESYNPTEKFDSYELEFRNSIEKVYFKIQNFLNEERWNINLFQRLNAIYLNFIYFHSRAF